MYMHELRKTQLKHELLNKYLQRIRDLHFK